MNNNGMLGFLDTVDIMHQQTQDVTLASATFSALNGRYKVVIDSSKMQLPNNYRPIGDMQTRIVNSVNEKANCNCSADDSRMNGSIYSVPYSPRVLGLREGAKKRM